MHERQELENALMADEARSAIQLTLVTSAGLLRNKHSGIVQSEVTLDDLFRP